MRSVRLLFVALLFVALALLASSCASQGDSAGSETTRPTTSETTEGTDPYAGVESPPDIVVSAGEDTIVLSAWAYCWPTSDGGICADGAPPDPLPSLKTDSPVQFSFELPDWSFEIARGDCDSNEVTITQLDANNWEVKATGSGLTEIQLFGRSSAVGADAIYSFGIELSAAGGSFLPKATVFGLTPQHGDHPVLTLTGPADTLRVVSATLTATNQPGASAAVTLDVAEVQPCRRQLLMPTDVFTELETTLGARPWDYVVRVEVDDGTGYHGQSQYLPWSIKPPVNRPFELSEVSKPLPPMEPLEDPFYVDLDSYEAHVRAFTQHLAEGDFAAASELVAADGHDLNAEMWSDAIGDGHVDAEAKLEAQLEQWCTVAVCTKPERVIVLLSERGNGTGSIAYDAIAYWPGDLSATFEFHLDDGVLGIIGKPPLI